MTKKSLCISYIRFSSAKQKQGDSLRRQLKESRKYAESRGLVLDETLSMRDEGLSAFKGDHISKGALGNFLKLIEKGRIPKGSIFIIENLDRLTRADILTALDLFTSIIKSGIHLVTLQDKMEYSRDSIDKNWTQLIVSISCMARAHEESRAKSIRIQDLWDEKRRDIRETPLTAALPAWLRLNKEKGLIFKKKVTGVIEPIPERAAIVKRIFKMYEQGKGNTLIAKTLNSEGIETWGKSTQWSATYIALISRNRAVIGQYQPHHEKNRKRVPLGDPIPDYFPRIITDDLFYKVQALIDANSHNVGRSGKNRNLFSGLIKCGYCGHSMVSIEKTSSNPNTKTRRYYACDKARLGLGCQKTVYFPKIELEKAFLYFCSEIDYEDLIPDKEDEKRTKIKTLKDKT